MLSKQPWAITPSDVERVLRTPRVQSASIRSALQGARARMRAFTVLILGDSTTAGLGGGDDGWAWNASAYRPAARMAHHLTRLGTPASADSQFGSDGACPEQGLPLLLYNPDVSYDPVAWGVTDCPNSLGGSHWLCLSATDSPFSFQPRHQTETFSWFVDRRSLHAARFFIDDVGLSQADVSIAQSGGIARVTVTAMVPGAHRAGVTRSDSAAGPLRVLGVMAVNHLVPVVSVVSAGNSGRGVGNLSAAATPLDAVPTIQAMGPDLAFINIGLNDMVAGVPPSHWRHLLGLLIDAVAESGQVVLVVPPKRLEVGDEVYRKYRETAFSLAQDRNSALLDLGPLVGPHAVAAQSGWYCDSVHMTRTGYDAIGVAYALAMLAL